jgi:hypothetical protein
MNFYYRIYFWTIRTHKRTGKVLDQRWVSGGEFENEAEALAFIKSSPNKKWRLTKESFEVLHEDKVEP